LTSSSNFTYETLNAVFTLNTLNLANNTLLYYTTLGNIISADFVSGNTGSFRTTSNATTITLATNSNIPNTEERFFQLQVRADSLTEAVVATSNVFTVKGSTLGAGPNVELLLVGGGGSGSNGNGGGGAGGLLYYGANATPKIANGPAHPVFIGLPYSIVVGGGGGNTQFSISGSAIYTALAGGSAVNTNPAPTPSGSTQGNAGGSGSGASIYPGSPGGSYTVGGAGTTGQGNPGGTASATPTSSGHGGGGGAGEAGGNGSGPRPASKGGNGLAYDTTGTGVYYAGGGGGWVNPSGPDGGGLGGLGGGGTSAPPSTQPNYGPSQGAVNTGGGGGGVSNSGGGSGIAVIRYPTAFAAAANTVGATVSTSGSYRIYKFTTSGTITF
jgi:hypothetical protein